MSVSVQLIGPEQDFVVAMQLRSQQLEDIALALIDSIEMMVNDAAETTNLRDIEYFRAEVEGNKETLRALQAQANFTWLTEEQMHKLTII